MVDRPEHLDEHGAQHEHVAALAQWVAPRSDFDLALLALVRLQARDGRDGIKDGRRRAMIQALDGQATWDQIRAWRRARRRVPQWAIELVATKLESYGEAGRQLRRSA